MARSVFQLCVDNAALARCCHSHNTLAIRYTRCAKKVSPYWSINKSY